jgi:hypothetical protein
MSGVKPRPLPAVVPATWLRVYEPLSVFGAADQVRWAPWAADGVADQVDQVERALAWRLLVAGAGVTGAGGGRADGAGARPVARVLRRDGTVAACPVPPGDRALVRAWQLPVAWLALVRPADRTPDGPGRYVVPMGVCRDRAARALRTLLGALGEGGVAERVAETAQWLEGFDPRSWVELDARCVVALVDGDGAEDVRMGLESLDDGDATGIAAAYRRIRRRDQLLRDLSRSS